MEHIRGKPRVSERVPDSWFQSHIRVLLIMRLEFIIATELLSFLHKKALMEK
jgi:hypothetical protein